jgi:oligopeptide transport system substrate-binding protein
VNQQVVESNPNWAQESESYVCNGPYKLKNWEKQHLLVLEKNPTYWQKDKVQLETVEIYTMNNETALHLFENKELNWIGSPLGTIPLDARGALADQLIVNDSAGTHFLRVNVTKKPLNDKDFRHALSLAVNRQMIIERIVKGKQKEAKGLVPTFFQLKTPTETAYNPELAQEIFAQVKNRFGEEIQLSLLYSNSEVNHRVCQVLQQNWKEVLGLDVELRPSETKGFYHTLQSKEYDLAIGSWYADVFDPSDFLDIFKEISASTNNTGWENNNYQALLDLSNIEMDQEMRRKILSQAQDILIDEMPMIPIYHASFLHLECGDIKGISLSPLGHLDFVDAQ